MPLFLEPKSRCQEKVSISKEKGSGYADGYIKTPTSEKQGANEIEN